jgi:hypothetical protein
VGVPGDRTRGLSAGTYRHQKQKKLKYKGIIKSNQDYTRIPSKINNILSMGRIMKNEIILISHFIFALQSLSPILSSRY